ncbi:uncharacterized protein BDV14DRAFT_49419 [Aspergillus stella-maris]|uniref:uncharacterized protein n=1 Tax=Aspergillus stella-maris TaxID=1810926 RepID=UPI003CCD739C
MPSEYFESQLPLSFFVLDLETQLRRGLPVSLELARSECDVEDLGVYSFDDYPVGLTILQDQTRRHSTSAGQKTCPKPPSTGYMVQTTYPLRQINSPTATLAKPCGSGVPFPGHGLQFLVQMQS